VSTQALAAIEPSAPVWRCALLWIDRNFPGWPDSVTFFEQKTRDLPVFSGGTGLRSNTTSSTYNICFTDKAGLAKVLKILPEVRVPREHWRVVPAGEADAAMLRKLRSFGYINTAEAAAEPGLSVPAGARAFFNIGSTHGPEDDGDDRGEGVHNAFMESLRRLLEHHHIHITSSEWGTIEETGNYSWELKVKAQKQIEEPELKKLVVALIHDHEVDTRGWKAGNLLRWVVAAFNNPKTEYEIATHPSQAEAAAEPPQYSLEARDFSFRVGMEPLFQDRFTAKLKDALKKAGATYDKIEIESGDVHRYRRHPEMDGRNLDDDEEEELGVGATDVDTVTITKLKFGSAEKAKEFCHYLVNAYNFYGNLSEKELLKKLLTRTHHVHAAVEPRPEMGADDFKQAISTMPSPVRGLNFRYLDQKFPKLEPSLALRVWRVGHDETVGSSFYCRFGVTDKGKITADFYRAGKKLHRICVLSEMRTVQEIQKHIYVAVRTHFLSNAHAAAEPEISDVQGDMDKVTHNPLVIKLPETRHYIIRRVSPARVPQSRFLIRLKTQKRDDIDFASLVFEPDDREINLYFHQAHGGYATYEISRFKNAAELVKEVIRACEHQLCLLPKTAKEQLGVEDTIKNVDAASEPATPKRIWTANNLGVALLRAEAELARVRNIQAGGCSVTFEDLEDDNTFVLSVSCNGTAHKVGFYPGKLVEPRLELRSEDDDVTLKVDGQELQKLLVKLPMDPVKALIVLVVAFVKLHAQRAHAAAEPPTPIDNLPDIELRLDDSWEFNRAAINHVIDDVEGVLKKYKCTFKDITIRHRTWDEEQDYTGHVVYIEGLTVPTTTQTLPRVFRDLFKLHQLDIRSTPAQAVHEVLEGMRRHLESGDSVVIGAVQAAAEPATDRHDVLWRTLLRAQDASFRFDGWNITVSSVERKQGNVVLELQIDPSVSDLRFVIAPDYVQVSAARGRDSTSIARADVQVTSSTNVKDVLRNLLTIKQHGKTLFQHYLDRQGLTHHAEAAAEPSATVPMHLRVYTKTSAGMPAFSGVVTSTKQRLEKLLHQYGAQPGKFEVDDEYYTWVGVLHCPKSQLLALALKLHAFGVHSDFDDDVEEIKNGLRSAIRYYPSVVCIGHGSIESEPTVAAAEPEAEPQPNKDGVVPYVHAVDGKIRGLLQLLTKWTAAERNPTGKESLRRLLVLCKNEAWPKLADASKKKLLELK